MKSNTPLLSNRIVEAANGIAILKNIWQPDDRLGPRWCKESDESIVKIASYAQSGSADLNWMLESKTYDLSRESIAGVTVDLANNLLKASKFLYLFVSLPSTAIPPVKRGNEPALNPLPTVDSIMALNTSDKPGGDWQWWMLNSIVPMFFRSKMTVVRDWLSCFGTESQWRTFENRAWKPYLSFSKPIWQRILHREPWPGASTEALDLRNIADYLGMLCKAIKHPEGRGVIDRGPEQASPDPYGCPLRLRLVQSILQSNGGIMATQELRAALGGRDPGQILSPAKGCSADDKEWANKHLKHGRGQWKWTPPSLPSKK